MTGALGGTVQGGGARVRLFVGAWPGDEAADALRSMRRPGGDAIRWVRADQWHVTLEFLGPADPVEAAQRLDRLVSPPATATLAAEANLLARSAVVFPVSGLADLAHAVRMALGGEGVAARDERRFVGHLTVGRLRRSAASRDLELPSLSGSVSWQVNEVSLVRSDLDERGATYRLLQRVRLA